MNKATRNHDLCIQMDLNIKWVDLQVLMWFGSCYWALLPSQGPFPSSRASLLSWLGSGPLNRLALSASSGALPDLYVNSPSHPSRCPASPHLGLHSPDNNLYSSTCLLLHLLLLEPTFQYGALRGERPCLPFQGFSSYSGV